MLTPLSVILSLIKSGSVLGKKICIFSNAAWSYSWLWPYSVSTSILAVKKSSSDTSLSYSVEWLWSWRKSFRFSSNFKRLQLFPSAWYVSGTFLFEHSGFAANLKSGFADDTSVSWGIFPLVQEFECDVLVKELLRDYGIDPANKFWIRPVFNNFLEAFRTNYTVGANWEKIKRYLYWLRST